VHFLPSCSLHQIRGIDHIHHHGPWQREQVAMTATIVMYHFVRPLAGSRWPRIKGLEQAQFSEQVDFLCRHYALVRLSDLVEAAAGGSPLPDRAAVLTFDDGYADHHTYAMPILRAAGVTGTFFPPSCAVLERKMLDVNKVHFILAAVKDPTPLVSAIDDLVDEARATYPLDSPEAYRKRFWAPDRFDPAEVIYFKRMLQLALPEDLRSRLATQLFRRFVSEDEAGFADELYLSVDQLTEMKDAGMEIGSHGHAHYWLNSLEPSAQAQDIDRSLDMLEAVGQSRHSFLFCYPYGAYNEHTLGLLRDRQCAAAVTTRVDLLRPDDDILELPRLDTNDLPKDCAAAPGKWTLQARAQPDTSP
jgi:peptidoglycan/xylan/chitin deacetylase (PgdA/CDA1 family)